MLSNWQETTLGNAITLKRGFDLPAQNRKVGHVPVVSSSGMIDTHSEAKVQGPGVIVGRYSTIGKVFYVEQDFWPLNTTFYVADFKGNNPFFIFLLLRVTDFDVYKDISSVPSISLTNIQSAKIRIPPLSEQHAIAAILGDLEAKINLNEKMNKTLDDIVCTIFKSWFVDFDPTCSKLASNRFLSMDQTIFTLFSNTLEESPLGSIPKGWSVNLVEEVVQIVSGDTPNKESVYWEKGKINWATPKDLISLSSHLLLNTEQRITEMGLQQISSGLLPKGTVLLSSRSPIGHFAITEVPVAINQGLIAIICNRRLPGHYVLHWARMNLEVIESLASGTTFLELNKANLRSMQIIVPSQEVLAVFNKVAKDIYKQMASNIKEIITLSIIINSLQFKLLTGEVRLEDAEQFL